MRLFSRLLGFYLILYLALSLYSCKNDDHANLTESESRDSTICLAISCWGDSKTEGWHDMDVQSYPVILQKMINDWGGHNVVYNLGAHGENSREILQRQGAIPLIVSPFIMPASRSDTVLVRINSRLRVPNTGCNPCYINDVKGSIIKDDNDVTHNTFYFVRESNGKSFPVPDSTRVITDAMLHRNNDIMIIDIGYNSGGYNGLDELVSQIRMMIDYSECKKFIVLGRVDNKKPYYELEEAFLKAFGENYINLRDFYVNEGLKVNGLQATDADKDDLGRGVAPKSLFFDKTHENYYGYYCKALCVFNKLIELGFISN